MGLGLDAARAVRGSSLGLLTRLKQILGIDLMEEAEVRDAGLFLESSSGDESPSDNGNFQGKCPGKLPLSAR